MKKNDNNGIGKKEYVFNFVSLIIVLIIGVYFGARSLYYYSKQNMKIKADSTTVNGLLISKSTVVKEGDGLHQDTDGYYFKGDVSNNYVSFGNRIFRAIRINKDGSVRLVSDDLVASFMWGEESSYAFSNLKFWLDKNDDIKSGVYYDTLPGKDKFLIKTAYREDVLDTGKVVKANQLYKDYVTTLSISDYVLAGGKNSFLNSKSVFYLLGLTKDEQNLYVDLDGSVKEADGIDGYGVRAVITLKRGLKVTSGDGTALRPFVVNQDKDVNYIDSYVRLGNDVYKVYQESNEGLLKMYKNGYATFNNNEILFHYSMSNSIFNLADVNNIAYYLNTTYLNSLPYAGVLADNYFFTGEVSSENAYKVVNNYDSSVICKVGLLNIFDYASNNSLNDYYCMNTTSTVGGIQYSKTSSGLLQEVDVREVKHFVPVISINKVVINGGDGTLENPYIVG